MPFEDNILPTVSDVWFNFMYLKYYEKPRNRGAVYISSRPASSFIEMGNIVSVPCLSFQ